MTSTPENLKPVLVTTKHRGVFAGLVPEDTDLSASTLSLRDARMAIYWGTTKGLFELAETGPTSKSRISARRWKTPRCSTSQASSRSHPRLGRSGAPNERSRSRRPDHGR